MVHGCASVIVRNPIPLGFLPLGHHPGGLRCQVVASACQEHERLKVAISLAMMGDVSQPRCNSVKRTKACYAGAELCVFAAALDLGRTQRSKLLIQGIPVARHCTFAIITAIPVKRSREDPVMRFEQQAGS